MGNGSVDAGSSQRMLADYQIGFYYGCAAGTDERAQGVPVDGAKILGIKFEGKKQISNTGVNPVWGPDTVRAKRILRI